MLQRYKYQHRLHLGEHFAQMLADRLTDRVLPDLIVPMPLHSARLAERGFNQSLEIAKHLSRRTGIPVEPTACARVKPSPPQASLPLKARVKNMKGAFSCEQRFEGLRIALVDDVMTTGASLNELARTLKAAGAAHIECWVVARTLPHA